MKGNSVGENDEMFMENSNIKNAEDKHVVMKEKSSSNEWGEHLSYLLESPEGKETSGEGSTQGFIWPSDHLGCVSTYGEGQQLQSQQHQQQEQPQHSNKQLQCSNDGWFSQTDLGSSDQGCFTKFFTHQ